MAVTFNIQFRISVATKVIRLTDTSTGFTYGKGCFKVEFPNGVVRNLPDFSAPDISTAGNYIDIPCEVDASGNVVTGSYIISYAVINNLSAGQTPLVRTFDFNWVEPANGITNFSDVITPEVVFKDLTSYSPIGSFTGALTRTISSSFPSTSEVSAQAPITSTSTNTITVVSGANYYEGVYTPTSNVSVAYTHTSNAWLTILYTRTFSKTFAIKKCPNQLELVQKINAYRVIIDAYKETNDTQFNILSEQYDLVIALYSHLIAMHQTSTQDGSEPILRELLSILEPYTGTYTYQSTKMLTFSLAISGANSFSISDGTNTDVVPLGSTLTFVSGNAALVPIVTNNNITYSPTFGTAINTFAQGNDSRFHNPVTIGTANGLSISTQALSLAAATTGSAGAMSASDKTKLDGIAAGATANTGTVTSVALTVPAAFSVTGSPITTSGTLAITAGGTSAEYITGAGALATLNTANVPENTNLYFTTSRARTSISLTTTGTTGAATYDNTTGVLNIPSYIGGVTSFNTRTGAIVLSSADVTTALTYTPVPNNRNLTINGVSFDLSADRSWTIASGVTSFNSRTGAITPTAGDYTTALVTEVTNLYYTDARARAAISLTTTGTSGSATYNNTTGVLNIPAYQGGVTSFNTRTGAITLTSSDVTTALTYTPYNATNPSAYIALTSLSFTAGSGGYNNTTGVITIPTNNNQITNGAGYITGITSGNVTTALGFTPENAANKGIANGYASLDGGGLVPSTQLPSYVDDVLEFANLAALPATGETGKIYVALDTNKIYRWSGATYIEVSPTVGTIWGGITGTLSNQTDLQNALNARVPYTGAIGAVDLGAYDLTVNELTIGKGASGLSNNTSLGKRALFHITTGNYNTGVGHEALHNTSTGAYNTALGQSAMFTNTTGGQNTAIGINALLYNTSGSSNVVVGLDSMQHNTTGSSNVALGYNAGSHITGGSTPNTTSGTSIYIGRDTRASANGGTNEIVIGNTTTGNGSNTVTIGNSSITANYFVGSINGSSFVKSGGTSSQFLKADGSVDSSTYLTGITSGQVTTALGYTPYNATNPSNYIALTALSSTATGLTYTNTTGVFSLTSGYVIPTTSSATNWDTAYTNRITTLTTTGSSGSATLSSNTLNIPTYTLSGLGGQPLSTNLTSLSGLTYASTSFVKMTASGTFALDTNTYYLASNPSSYIALTALSSSATGLTYTNTTGVFSLTAGYEIPTTASIATWDTAYTNRITSLTTTGSSGASTLVSNVLNIPTYTLTGLGGVPTTRSLTINGTAYDLSADRTWTISTNPSARVEQNFVATAAQTTFTITGGYVVGLVDVYVNGVRYLPTDYTATNGTTVVLGIGLLAGDAVTILNYTSSIAALPTSRNVQDYTATAAQTTFTVTNGYIVGLIDVFVNGSKLTSSEFTATNGTTFVLTVASTVGDQVQSINYTASVNGISGAGTANYVPKFTASGTIGNSSIFDNGSALTFGLASTFSSTVGIGNAISAWSTGTFPKVLQVGNASLVTNGTAFAQLTNNMYFDGSVYRYITSNGASRIIFESDGVITFNNAASGTAGNTVSTTERMRITSGGNVAIGLTTAASPLTIQATSGGAGIRMVGRSPINQDNEIAFIANDNSTVQAYFTTSNAGMDIITVVNQPMRFSTNSVERLQIASAGRIFNSNAPANDFALTITGSATTSQSYGINIYAGTNSSDMSFQANSKSGTSYFKVSGDGSIANPTHPTTANAANVHMTVGGTIYRSTSSLKYKNTVTDYDKGLDIVNQLRPVYYKGNKDGDTIFAGLIAEEVHELGLTEYVQYAEDGSPDALAYPNMVALLIKSIQQQQSQIEELKTLLKA